MRYEGFADSQHTTAVCWGGGLNKYQAHAGDAFQRPLRSRFQARLTRGVRPILRAVRSWHPIQGWL